MSVRRHEKFTVQCIGNGHRCCRRSIQHCRTGRAKQYGYYMHAKEYNAEANMLTKQLDTCVRMGRRRQSCAIPHASQERQERTQKEIDPQKIEIIVQAKGHVSGITARMPQNE